MPGIHTTTTKFVSGPHVATILHPFGTGMGEVFIGEVEDGFEIEVIGNAEVITADRLGRAPVEMVMGGPEIFINFTLLEWDHTDKDLLKFYWPYGKAPDPMFPEQALGRLDDIGCATNLHNASANRKFVHTDFYLTRDPQAACATPINWRFHRVIQDQATPLRYILASRLRRLPMRLRCFPVYQTDHWEYFKILQTLPP